MEINKEALLQIVGGIKINGTMLGHIIRGINSILDLGRSIGNAIRRSWGGNLCPIP